MFPIATSELLHFPMMFPETMRGMHLQGIPYARLEFLYEVGALFGLAEGTVRTALSRMKKSGYVDAIKSGSSTRYRVSPLQIELMNNMGKGRRRRKKGFVVAVYSFESGREKERAMTRSLLEYAGFVRFAQNSYINTRIDRAELKARLRESGLSSNVFLFDVEDLMDDDMERMASAWKIPERAAHLDSFMREVKAYVDESDGSDSDTFHRLAGAWVAYIVHVERTEPPLPEVLLPERYAYPIIADYLRRTSIGKAKKMMRYYLARNR
jgi:DNA-binding transcriptional regulator PaaX